MQYLKNKTTTGKPYHIRADNGESLCGWVEEQHLHYWEIHDHEPMDGTKPCSICAKELKAAREQKKKHKHYASRVYRADDYQPEPIELDNETLRRLDALTDSQVSNIFPDKFSQEQFRKGLLVYREIAAANLPGEFAEYDPNYDDGVPF